MEARDNVTALLGRWSGGDRQAFRQLVPLVYAELRRLAGRAIRGERKDHTLQATALVHEAYLRLANGCPPSWKDRVHFYSVAARMMRRILVDHARGLHAARRGGGAVRVPLDGAEPLGDGSAVRLIELDDALVRLASVDRRKARVIELRFFGGLSVAETAAMLGVSEPTVILDTRIARAWLYARIYGGVPKGRA